MKLSLLDIDRTIDQEGIKEVKSPRIYTGGGRTVIDPNGLFSEEVFGRLGSRQRKTTFGYIKLNTTIIHPEAYSILTSINTDLAKLILDKDKYIITDAGLLVQDSEKGESGVHFFVQNFDKFKFSKMAKKEKSEEAAFIIKNKNKVLITKLLVLPAGVRDIHTSNRSGKTMIESSEISTLYEKLLKQCGGISTGLPDEIMSPMLQRIQRTTMEINSWIKDRMKGKHGLIRGGVLKRVTDYSGRMVIGPDPKLKLGYVGLPWQSVLKLFEPFALNYILYKDKTVIPLIQSFLTTEEEVDISTIRRFIKIVNNDPISIKGQLKIHLIQIAKDITNGKVVVYKRDPVENRDSWISAYIRVDDSGFLMKTNPFDLEKNG